MSRKSSVPEMSLKTKLDATLDEYKRVRDKLAGVEAALKAEGRYAFAHSDGSYSLKKL